MRWAKKSEQVVKTICHLRHSYDGEASRPNYSCAGSLVGWSTRLITGRSQVQVLPRALIFTLIAEDVELLYTSKEHEGSLLRSP